MQSQLSKWERGVVMPQFTQLENIARWDGVSLATFGVQGAFAAGCGQEARALLRDGISLMQRALERLEGK